MRAASSTHNVLSIEWDVLHAANVSHEWAGRIAYDTCISISYIPLLSLGGVQC